MADVVVPELELKSDKPEDKFVSKDAYLSVSSDMHKYKSEMKTVKAELEKLRADEQKRSEEEQLKNGEFKKLADTYRLKYEEVENSRKAEKEKVVNLHKLHSLEKLVGGFQRPEYARIAANLDKILVNEEGLIDEESVKAEAARIRQEHPALLKNQLKSTMPNLAPGIQVTNLDFKTQAKACKTQEELKELASKMGLF